jgi:hypothetical protein
VTFAVIGLIGFVVSLGPILKVGSNFAYTIHGIAQSYILPLPYLFVDKFLPQLSFIRAIGRASVIMLFAMCCIVAIGSVALAKLDRKKRLAVVVIFAALAVFELMPPHTYMLSRSGFTRNLSVPAVYQYIAKHPSINDLIILRTDKDYPGAAIPVVRAEDVLWAGYHNRNIFNGYSGYEPKSYASQYMDFVDFHPDDVPKLQKLGIHYVIVDKLLSGKSPLLGYVRQALPDKLYEDSRYALFKI